MEIKEIWTEFKDRITSPFFGSFVISWSVFNWRVPVVLFFYKNEELIKSNTTYIDVIQRYTGFWVSLVFPIVSAFIYTFGYPIFKRWINTYTAQQTLKTDEKLLKLSETAPMSQAKFIEMNVSLKKSKNELLLMMSEESAIQIKNGELENTISQLNLDILKQEKLHKQAITELNKEKSEDIRKLSADHNDNTETLMKDYGDMLDLAKIESQEIIEKFENQIIDKSKTLSLQKELLDKRNEEFARLEKRYDQKEQEYLKLLSQEESTTAGNELLAQKEIKLNDNLVQLQGQLTETLAMFRTNIETDHKIITNAILVLSDVIDYIDEKNQPLTASQMRNMLDLKDGLNDRSKGLHSLISS